MVEENRFTVSELTELIKVCLEGTFSTVLVEGEVSNCRPSSTGHLYFTLKDAGASISAVMFKHKLRSLSFEPKDGMLVRVRGNLSVYAQRGSYQVICDQLERAGVGDLLALLEERKRKLASEGLFDEGRKKSIPRFPESIGIISSPTGAALRDILNVLERRAAGVKLVILPSPVQGDEAAAIIARRIQQANDWKLADVLIVGRGGGSLEDLLAFSDEKVVRAIAASKIPIISAVGHEIDWALSDFAADLRAPTPSAAAELVSSSRIDALDRVRELEQSLRHNIETRLERARLLAKPFAPEDLEFRFRTILQPRLVRFDDAKEALLNALTERIGEGRRRLELAKMALEAASPLAALERGFSVVMDLEKGTIVRDAKQVDLGTLLSIQPLSGKIIARSEVIKATSNEPA
ncbi:exodeoxyribonuclease VII large subunit [Treponema sp.]